MLEKRCTIEKAEKIYLKRLEKSKKLASPSEASPGRKSASKDDGFLGLKTIYDNIIHA